MSVINGKKRIIPNIGLEITDTVKIYRSKLERDSDCSNASACIIINPDIGFEFYNRSKNGWNLVLQSSYGNADIFWDDSVAHKAEHGFQKLPSGVIIQWSETVPFELAPVESRDFDFVFPITFPKECWNVIPAIECNIPEVVCSCSEITTTGVKLHVSNNGMEYHKIKIMFHAIGM